MIYVCLIKWLMFNWIVSDIDPFNFVDMLNWIVWNRTVWHLTVGKEMTDV